MRTFDFITGRHTDDRKGVTFYDLTEYDDDVDERLDALEEQVTVLTYRVK